MGPSLSWYWLHHVYVSLLTTLRRRTGIFQISGISLKLVFIFLNQSYLISKVVNTDFDHHKFYNNYFSYDRKFRAILKA